MPREPLTQPLPKDLQDLSFRGMDCEGWDFSGRDIRGCDFRNANLKDANFINVVAGRSFEKVIKHIRNIFFLVLLGVVSGISSFSVLNSINDGTKIAFDTIGIVLESGVGGVLTSIVFAVLIVIVALISGIVAGLIPLVMFVDIDNASDPNEFSTGGFPLFASVLAGIDVGILLKAIELFGKGEIVSGLGWSFAFIVLLAVTLFTFVEAIKEFQNVTGTNFKGSNLQGVRFCGATLSNCKFNDANTRYVNWTGVKGERSDIDFTYTRMQLMISRKGSSSQYPDLDLSAQNLAGVDLVKANLAGADLTASNLQGADLTFANLSNTKAGGTDFRHATLTGACIANWTINSDTQFDDLTCDYIYLTPDRNPQNRRPLSGSFEPGDFEKLVDKFADTLDFILRRGTEPAIFRQALSQFQQDNPEARLNAMVELDKDRVLVRATLPPDTDKVQPYEKFYQDIYIIQTQLQAATQEIRYLERTIQDKDKTITMMEGLVYSANQRPMNKIIEKGTYFMTYKSGRDINVAKDKSAINTGYGAAAAGNISGNLTLNLTALQETQDPKKQELADLISQLRSAIESPDCDLDDRFKTRAIEYLDNLAQLAQEQPTPENYLKKAKENLEDLNDIAEKGSKLATFATKYLPTFTTAIMKLGAWFGV
ncbi:MAG: hypothetical protein B0A82_03160 [Alkalinema sp. CACIAM 70d]|nr:MAG: hypothetical protein B0A82_03160 [Alkalinema sp. CACIAM 70d]